MSSFKRTYTKNYSKVGPKPTSDSLYWKNLEFPVTVKEFSAIDYIDVSSQEPHYIAVTAGLKVDIYHQQTTQVWKSLTRFQSKAYGGTFRQDGQLLVAGAENGQVMLFNYRLKQLLRIFKGHKGPVHRAKFISSSPQIVSFCDDKTVNLWDMTDETKLCAMSEHTDFIRAGCVNPASDNIVISGSYDHMVKMWDTRTGKSVLTVDHGAPVESLVCYPTGSVFISAGGNEIRVWDAVSRRLLSKFSHHHKTITSITLASDNRRLLSGSLDRHVKIYDVDTYSAVHNMDYLAPVLSLAVAPRDSTVVVGMISSGTGLLSFQHRKDLEKNPVPFSQQKPTDIRNITTYTFDVKPGDEVMHHEDTQKLAVYDVKLRKFEYSRCLDAVMRRYLTSRTPHVVVSVLKELLRRNGLKSALAGRNAKTLTPVVRFIIKNIRNPKFKRVLLEIAECLLDVYGDQIEEFPFLVKHFRSLQEEINIELENANENVAMMGLIEMFLASSEPQTTTVDPSPLNLNKETNLPAPRRQTSNENAMDVS